VRLIGQPERLMSVMFGLQAGGQAPQKNCLQYCTGCLRVQPVANRNQFYEEYCDGEIGHVESDDA
jgi:hypothetical protein